MSPDRYLADWPLPEYSYVPGLFPHPSHADITEDGGEGQSGGGGQVGGQRGFLRGLDLFHHGYYWESHESWEQIWKRYARASPTACLLQGLIKLAAAGVKAREGRVAGVRSHASRAGELFDAGRRGGLTQIGMLWTDVLLDRAREVHVNPSRWINTSREPVVQVFPFRLDSDPAQGDEAMEGFRT